MDRQLEVEATVSALCRAVEDLSRAIEHDNPEERKKLAREALSKFKAAVPTLAGGRG
jgi:uncharacterized protein YukE